eukprot:3939186-Rhodomonas_salina.1
MGSDLDAMCSAVLEAKQMVANGNCVAAGDCVTVPFFYSPAVFSVSNNDFIRMTVQSFYENHDPAVCPSDDDTQALIEQNTRLQSECASTWMSAFKDMLMSLRPL